MKRSYLNKTLKLVEEVKNVCTLPQGYEHQWLFDELEECVGEIVHSIYMDAVGDHEHEVVWEFGSYTKRIPMSEEQEKALRSVTPQMIYDHLRNNSIGKVDCLKNRFVPDFEVGGISVSIQISYLLDCYRDKTGVAKECPITDVEFDDIIGKSLNENVNVDVKYFKGNRTEISNAIQQTLSEIAETLNDLGTKDKIQID